MFKQVSLPLNSSLLNTDWHGQRLVPSLCVSTADQVTGSWDSEAEDCKCLLLCDFTSPTELANLCITGGHSSSATSAVEVFE